MSVGKCLTTSGPSCHDEICYVTIQQHKEGELRGFGCFSGLQDLSSSSCAKLLNESSMTTACVETGGKETCCCTAEETALCNRAWTYHSFFPIFTTVELLKVFGLLGLILFVYCLLRRFIRKRTFFVTKEIADDLLRTIVRVETNLAVLKVLMLLAFILIAWFPVQYTCKLHNEGIFNTPYYVLMQLPYFDDVGILYSCLPLLSLLFDFERLRLISKGVFSAAEIISVVSFILLLSNFCLLGGLFIEYDSLKEAEKQEKYCKLGWAQWTTVTSAVLLVMHCITTILSEVWTWYLYQKNDKLLKENDIRTTTSAVEVTTQSPLNTACIETLIEEDEHVVITPAPFCLDRNGEGVLTVVNRHPQHWIAVRILVSAPNAYSTHPKKLILPPQRSATTEIRLLKCSTPVSGSRQGVMIQWFAAGSSCPPMDAERIWLRPFFRPQSEWKCYILPIYHETETEEG